MRALSVRQPWAALIVAGVKAVEYRGWSTAYRGPLLIHAARRGHDDGTPGADIRGAIVGMVDLVDVTSDGGTGRAWHLRGAVRFAEPIPLRGQLGIFDVDESTTQRILTTYASSGRLAETPTEDHDDHHEGRG